MAPEASSAAPESNRFQDFVQAIADRRGELDIRLEHLTLRLPIIRDNIELNGMISVSVHLRDLSEKEKAARVAKELRVLAR